jgi:hypothetical protein
VNKKAGFLIDSLHVASLIDSLHVEPLDGFLIDSLHVASLTDSLHVEPLAGFLIDSLHVEPLAGFLIDYLHVASLIDSFIEFPIDLHARDFPCVFVCFNSKFDSVGKEIYLTCFIHWVGLFPGGIPHGAL